MKNDKIKEHYNKYWNESRGEFRDYIRNLSLPGLFIKGESVLDIGCGDGVVANFLQEAGLKVTGIDISEEAIYKARKKGVNARVYDSQNKFPFADNSFDIVFWGDNIEHLFNPTFCIKEIKRVLKKNGRLILSCPNMSYWRYRIYYLFRGQLPDTEWTGLPPWEWSHIRFFNLTILKQFLLKSGFKRITKVIGISERRIDKPFLLKAPSLFGMILLLEVLNE